jgi:hypothetical protein
MTDEYVKLLTSVNGDRPTRAVRTLGAKDTFRLSLGRRDGISTVLYEITHYPPGFACPYGWQEGGGGVYYCIRDDGLPAPEINLGIAPWGKYVFRATGNGGYRDGILHNWPYDGTSMVDQTAVQVLSPTFGFESFADNEGTLCDDGGQAAILDRNFRKLEGHEFGGDAQLVSQSTVQPLSFGLIANTQWSNTEAPHTNGSNPGATEWQLMYLPVETVISKVLWASYYGNLANGPWYGGGPFAPGSIQCGIYDTDVDGSYAPNGMRIPGSLLYSSNSYSPSGEEYIGELTFTPAIVLPQGLYYLAFATSALYHYVLRCGYVASSTHLGGIPSPQFFKDDDVVMPATVSSYSDLSTSQGRAIWLYPMG